jgi:type IV pilus assembly protein PilC
LLDLQFELEQGVSLADALAAAVPEVSVRQLGLLDFAEHGGKLPQALDRLIREHVGQSRQFHEKRALAYWYPPVLLLAGGVCIGLLGIFVFPRFVYILRDFKIPMPAITRWVIGGWEMIFWFLPVVLLGLLMMCGLRLRDAMRIGRPNWFLRRVRDRIVWWLPLLHVAARDRAMSDLCASLADAAELGVPLDHALRRAEQLDLNLIVQRRVASWGDGIASGMLPAEAARKAGMPPLLVGMLSTARQADDAAEVFDFVARFYGSRFDRRRELLRGAYIPVVTLLMGLMVAAIALALFVPMQQLIQSAAPKAGGL